jgi:hypothetical protein
VCAAIAGVDVGVSDLIKGVQADAQAYVHDHMVRILGVHNFCEHLFRWSLKKVRRHFEVILDPRQDKHWLLA